MSHLGKLAGEKNEKQKIAKISLYYTVPIIMVNTKEEHYY
jgi:hypothetical protein